MTVLDRFHCITIDILYGITNCDVRVFMATCDVIAMGGFHDHAYVAG